MKGFGKCVAVRICPQFCFCGESISKNAFRWFESVYRPEMMREQSSARKCIYKISKNFRVEKSGEISRNLRFSRFFVPASKSDTHHGWGIGIRTPTNRVRVCRAAVTQFPNIRVGVLALNGCYYSRLISICQDLFENYFKKIATK